MKKTMTGAFLCALLACWCGTVAAESSAKPIFKCVASNGALTFQSAPCAADAVQSEVKLREEPKAPVPIEEVTAAAEPPPLDPETGLPIEKPTPKELVSYECTTSKGWVFFKHRPCPPGVREAVPVGSPHDPSDRLASTQGEWLRVTGAPIPRIEACRRINDLSAGAREGRVFDDIATDRDRAAGHDPCSKK